MSFRIRQQFVVLSCLLLWSGLVLGASDCEKDPPKTGTETDGGGMASGATSGSGATAGKSGSNTHAGTTAGGNAGDTSIAADGGTVLAQDAGGSGGAVCGTRGGVTCADKEFCKLDETCGETDRGGQCQAMPEVCTEIYAPVCGCDGKTYSSDCVANGAGVSVRYEGECKAAGECKIVKTEPFVCTDEYAPVCGCDHKTYGNACAAGAVSSISHEGACNESDCKAVGGRAVFGLGPAPECNKDEDAYTSLTPDDGSTPIEGELCCVPK